MESAVEILGDILVQRSQRNPSYSLRALARDIECSPTFLSLVLSGKRRLSLQRAKQISQSLQLPDHTKNILLRAVATEALSQDTRELLDPFKAASESMNNPLDTYFDVVEDRETLLKHWYHVAILDLASTKNFKPDTDWIAKRLGISGLEARDAVNRLIRLGLVEVKGAKWRKTENRIFVKTKNSQKAIREFHQQMAQRAIEVMKASDAQKDFEARSISGITMAIDPSRVEKARKMIAKFQDSLADLMTEGSNCTEVYQLNVQFFPLTVLNSGSENKS
jgi:uncharacterized protein (TIGR02147 family)